MIQEGDYEMKKPGKLFSVILAGFLILASLSGLNVFAEDDAIIVSGFYGDATRIEKGTSMKMLASGVTQGKSVSWSVTGIDGSATDLATIEQTGALTGILTASADSYGTFKVVATQNDTSGKKGEQIINITNENLITVDDTDSSINYVSSGSGEVWEQNNNSDYYLGTGKCVIPPEDDSYSSQDPAYAEFTFTGTGIQWIGESNYYCGVAEVYLDGVKMSTVDPFIAPGIISQFVNFSREGLPYGQHTIRVVAIGLKNPASTQYPGTRVLVDAFRYSTEAPQVDKSDLQEKISEAQALNASDYTDETWTNMQTALIGAITINDNPAATQQEVDGACANLQAAINGLVFIRPTVVLTGNDSVQPESAFTVGISLSGITQSIYAEDITLSYDPAVFEYEMVTNADENVNILGDTSPAEGLLRIVAANIGGVAQNNTPIINVHFKVKNGVNNTSSTISVTSAELGIMPEGTVVEAGLSSKTITVGTVSQVSKDALRAAIETAESKYNSAVTGVDNGCYWQADKDLFQAAITAAKAVYADSGASQAEVDNATGKLNAAILAFEASVINPSTGDIDDSSTIDVADLAMVAYYYGMDSSNENWASAVIADINKDGKIDIEDLSFIASRM